MVDTNVDIGEKIEFVQFHQPGLVVDDYIITVTQEITLPGNQKAMFSTQKHFAISGERFTFNPQDIQAVFPPEGSLGEHSNVLPHIAFTRSTLPWERQADPTREDVPWLALLLFEDQGKPESQIVQLGDLMHPPTGGARFPDLQLNTGQKADDQATVIDIKKGVLQTLLPTLDALALLTHVRVRLHADGSQDELAVVIGSRLPVRGGSSTVHLVSLEGRYSNGGFDYQGAGDDDLIRLVSLKSWSFACVDEKQSFKGLLMHLDRNPGTLRLPKNDNAAVERYLAMGYTLLPHTFRLVGKSVSWYHGPLVPVDITTELTLPVRAADELVRYNPANGLFDISYAAAWELGRLLALQSKQFAINLYLWKRMHAQLLRQAEQQILHAHLPIQPQSVDPSELFAAISAWFTDLSLLRGVPFNYLVPDERILPEEAIRFFRVDHLWMECLLDGAFSIGRVSEAAYAQDQNQANMSTSPATMPFDAVTGFLLRSDVVSGWPGLLVNASDANGKELDLLRMDRLSPDVLLCLFNGEIDSVAVHQKPEMLHSGLDMDEQIPPTYHKVLRDNQGDEQETLTLATIPWLQEGLRIIDIPGLARAIQQKTGAVMFTAAQFAFQMTEGVEEVIFHKG
ncbi:hypothetical protein KSF_006030 [Reticulibacter mediterranei]|uniref:Uncharacterized protein n=1 Tax=Reticulibacter mediterranei TaxID=2778369 RepID=A0A8J3IGX5_9CHLR|nr:hypothetical protein [Reticulibacter mediterranei]GHO90555.1 hypothetical protein KSF_006030 [Reticulibacter mediterranei]